MLYYKSIDEINLQDMMNIVDEEIIEDKHLEYKGQMEKDAEKSKINTAVCGFANADGGLFIYGIEEENKKPTKITGISLNDTSWDDRKRSILSSISRNIEPRVRVEIKEIQLDDSENVIIVIKIPKSWNAPHCIKKNSGKIRSFYIRRDGSTEPMEFEEIREMFDLTNNLQEKINNFRDEQISKISSVNTEKYKIIFHAIPFDAFSKPYINLKNAKDIMFNLDFFSGFYNSNFEGLYNDSHLFKIQLFRNGIIESILEEYREEENNRVNITPYIDEFKNFVKGSLKLYRQLNIFCPIVFFVTVTNIKGREMLPKIGEHFILSDKERDILNPVGCIIENDNQIETEVHNIFVPILNHFGKNVEYEF